MSGSVTAVSSSGAYSFTRPNRVGIALVAGAGIEAVTKALAEASPERRPEEFRTQAPGAGAS